MKRRPALKVGDVVRLSKKSRRRINTAMIVHSFKGDSSEGLTKITCNVIVNRSNGKTFGHKIVLQRRELWSTGYNARSLEPNQMMTTPEGRDWERNFKASEATNHICSCSIDVIMSQGCICGGK